MLSPHEIVLRPIVSEKSYGEMDKQKYSFSVDPRANKIEIAKAVEKLFNVTVVKVNTIVIKPKPKRLGRSSGYTSHWKKAVVTLKPGDKIEFFEGA